MPVFLAPDPWLAGGKARLDCSHTETYREWFQVSILDARHHNLSVTIFRGSLRCTFNSRLKNLFAAAPLRRV